LIDSPGRSQTNYRRYRPDAVWRVQAIAILRGPKLAAAGVSRSTAADFF
jgi:hypothetical protein